MKEGRKKHMIIKIVLLVLIVMVILGAINFISVRKKANKRVARYEKMADTIETSFGKLTYIEKGDKEPIISCHGICGGYDQAYDTLAGKEDSYRIIAPSRFGYLGSDMPKNATIAQQADAYVELLDSLSIEKSFILATSAGGPSAIEFALLHPDRTKGLILYCSAYPGLSAPKKELTLAGPPAALCNDFAMWAMSPLFEPIMGMSQDTLQYILPMKDRKEGIVFDGKVTNTVMVNDYQEYDLSKLKVPVLIIHSKDDKLSPFSIAQAWAKKIPDCTFLPLEGGGHLMKGHDDAIANALASFVKKNQ